MCDPREAANLPMQTQFRAASTTLMVSNPPYLNAPGLFTHDLSL